ncbi:MAG: VIT domain-containing protein [Nannocystaceae bacterium]
MEQSFANDRAAVLEGIYRFPLPGDASIAGLQLLVGNRWMDGEIVEKQRGREIFQHIVDATVPRDPALLEWERANLFKLRLFPIPARGERRVRLSYTQVLPVVGDAVQYRFPLGGSGTRGPAIDHFAFTVHVDRTKVDLAGLDRVATPMLALDRSEDGDTVTFHAEQVSLQPSYDLGLDPPLAKDDRRVHADTHLDRDGQAYFMLALQPQLQLAADDRPLHFAFVLDRSHSTTPELWTAARGLVEALSSGLDAGDRFTVLACDAACDELPSGVQHRRLRRSSRCGASSTSRTRGRERHRCDGARGRRRADAHRQRRRAPRGRLPRRWRAVAGALAPDELAQEIRDGAPGLTVSAIALGARVDEAALAVRRGHRRRPRVRAAPTTTSTRCARAAPARARGPGQQRADRDACGCWSRRTTTPATACARARASS